MFLRCAVLSTGGHWLPSQIQRASNPEGTLPSLPDISLSHGFFGGGVIYLFNLFIFGCVGSSFLCEGFLQLRRAGTTLHRGARASHYRGLSCCGAQAPDAQAQ